MFLLSRLFGCGSSCEIDRPLDYADDAHWLCRPGVDRACPPGRRVVTIRPDGTTAERRLEAPADPGLACFGVYPTLDLKLGQGLHHDTDRVREPEDWARTQAIWLSEVCDLWIPVYRQVRLGTYGGRPDAASATGAPAGGSFAEVPACADRDTPGCAAGYRSFLAGEDPPPGNRFLEGADEICTHPGQPEAPTRTAPLRAFVMAPDHAMVDRPRGIGRRDDLLLEWPDAFDARCTRDRLEVTWQRPDDPPIRLRARSITGAQGSHVLDFNLGIADVVEDVRRRAATWTPADDTGG